MFENADATMNSKSSFDADRPPVSVLRDFFNFIRKNAEIITNNWNAAEYEPSTLSTTSANPDITLTVNTAIKYKYDPRIAFILILPTRMERCHFTGRNVPPAAVFTGGNHSSLRIFRKYKKIINNANYSGQGVKWFRIKR
jgi:hypothetical protein